MPTILVNSYVPSRNTLPTLYGGRLACYPKAQFCSLSDDPYNQHCLISESCIYVSQESDMETYNKNINCIKHMKNSEKCLILKI